MNCSYWQNYKINLLTAGLRAIFASCVFALLGLCLDACGGSHVRREAVRQAAPVQVARHELTASVVNHWTEVEAILSLGSEPRAPAPKGAIPDPPTYSSCIAYSARSAEYGPNPTTAQLKAHCERRYRELRHEALEVLIGYYWVSEAAAEAGVTVTRKELDGVEEGGSRSRAAFERYLFLTHESPADAQLLAERDLLTTKLFLQLERTIRAKGAKTAKQWTAILLKEARAFTRHWISLTSCKAGYIVPKCKQYKGPFALFIQ